VPQHQNAVQFRSAGDGGRGACRFPAVRPENHHPSKANEAAFNAALDEIARASLRLLDSLETSAPRRNREAEAAKARARADARFGPAAAD